MNKSTVLYCAHFKGNNLPSYIRIILKDLLNHCSRLIVITEEKQWNIDSLDFMENHAIEILPSPNKGYDFGKWYWAFKKLSFIDNDRIILMNDSMLQISSIDDFFDWCNSESAAVKGFLNSNERKSHLQSFLLVLDKKAIYPTIKYFKRKKRYRQKRKVIRHYELGLPDFWAKNKLEQKTYFDINSIKRGFKRNPNYFLITQLLQLKTPLIKRHILMDSFGEDMRDSLHKQNFNFDHNIYLELIKNNYSKKDYEALLRSISG